MSRHYVKGWSDITACGRNKTLSNIDFSSEPSQVDCGLCVRTTEFKKARSDQVRTEGVMPITETVGIPTQTAALPPIHMAFSSNRPESWCPGGSTNPDAYSTMDLDAVSCPDCLNSGMYSTRRRLRSEGYIAAGKADPLAEQMGFTGTEPIEAGHEPDDDPIYESDLNEDEESPLQYFRDHFEQEDRRGKGVSRDHDAPFRPHPHQGQWTHDCDRCYYLGSYRAADLYFCRQDNGVATVISRFGNEGGEYKSGMWSAKEDPALALAVVKAFHRGLLTVEDAANL